MMKGSPKYLVFLVVLASTLLISAADFLHNAPREDFEFRVPSNFPKPVYDTKRFPVTKEGFLLGKTLFYDAALSVNGTVSCATCHQQSGAFANLNSAVSRGVNGCKGSRNTPALFNLAWQKEFMWDGRIADMQQVPANAIGSDCEMGSSVISVVTRLRRSNSYPALFREAFGSDEISGPKLLNALGQFTALLVSANSKYDHVMRKEANAAFSTEERKGYMLFRSKCGSCHREPLFTDGSYRNNGLDEVSADRGRDSVTHRPADQGKFRVPSLRNSEITGPYMHDGRFGNLKDVLAHYASGMHAHANLDAAFRANGKTGVALTAREQSQVIAFLKTLTDVDFINDRRFNTN